MPLQVLNFVQTRSAGGKFVVLKKCDDPERGLILFSDFSRDSQHADIVRRWEKTSHTTLAASGLKTFGGGWWAMGDGGILKLYGQSAAYGHFDRIWVGKHLRSGSVFNEEKILIE